VFHLENSKHFRNTDFEYQIEPDAGFGRYDTERGGKCGGSFADFGLAFWGKYGIMLCLSGRKISWRGFFRQIRKERHYVHF
jgi:hypothetical protein